ncbi:MAG: branched-chain amino acid ABC transporter permease [Dehalococcoidales bacterium]|nr:branched-chain amino acid ABC transporter permease [Dehalococcoidales bacterium]
MYANLTVSWVLFSGSTGYMSLATAAFFGIGIYASALFLPTTGAVFPVLVVVLIGGLASSLVALGVGALTLRLRGIYFAIFTFVLVVLIMELGIWWELSVSHLLGRYVILVDNNVIFYTMLGIFVLVMLTTFFIRRSKFGLAMRSIGENEEAASHIGINVTMVKVITFAISAFFMGATGAIWATKLTYVDPHVAFNVLFSFMPVLMAIFGGMGNIYGPVIGAVIFAYLQETLQTKFPEIYMLSFGVLLVAAILYLPNGVTGLIQKLWKRISGGKRAHT